MSIKHNYLTIADTKPTAAETSQHEIVVNEADGSLWSKSSTDVVFRVGGTSDGGGGDPTVLTGRGNIIESAESTTPEGILVHTTTWQDGSRRMTGAVTFDGSVSNMDITLPYVYQGGTKGYYESQVEGGIFSSSNKGICSNLIIAADIMTVYVFGSLDTDPIPATVIGFETWDEGTGDYQTVIGGGGGELMPVGSVVLRMDATDPSTIYGGIWTLITGDANLTFGDGTVQDGIGVGLNEYEVPLIEHVHAHNHTHQMGASADIDVQTGHFVSTTTIGDGGVGGSVSTGAGTGFKMQSGADGDDLTFHIEPTATIAGFTEGVDVSNTDPAGLPGAQINVRGSQIAINVWQRTG